MSGEDAPSYVAGSVVYVIGGDQIRPVKIGTTTDLARRLQTLQGASPFTLRVLWVAEGDRALELLVHQRLSRFRVRGEWFDFGSRNPVAVTSAVVRALSVGAAVDQVPSVLARMRAQARPVRRAVSERRHSRLPEQRRPRTSTANRVLALLEDRGVVTTAMIIDHVETLPSTAVTVLRRLQQRGLVVHIAHGIWAAAPAHTR